MLLKIDWSELIQMVINLSHLIYSYVAGQAREIIGE
jgi:hypothetical protein